MSTKVSLYFNDDIEVHIYNEQMDGNYYMQTDYGTVLLTEGLAKALADKFKKLDKKEDDEIRAYWGDDDMFMVDYDKELFELDIDCNSSGIALFRKEKQVEEKVEPSEANSETGDDDNEA